jgi:hypothetical protein
MHLPVPLQEEREYYENYCSEQHLNMQFQFVASKGRKDAQINCFLCNNNQ